MSIIERKKIQYFIVKYIVFIILFLFTPILYGQEDAVERINYSRNTAFGNHSKGWNKSAAENHGTTAVSDSRKGETWYLKCKTNSDETPYSATEITPISSKIKITPAGETIITSYRIVTDFNVAVNTMDLTKELIITPSVRTRLESRIEHYGLGWEKHFDWESAGKVYSTELHYTVKYTIDDQGGIAVTEGVSVQDFKHSFGGILGRTSVALSQIVPTFFPDNSGQIFANPIILRSAYSKSFQINNISIKWGRPGDTMWFDNADCQSEIFTKIINISKIKK